MSLVEFLTARLDEDERIARAATPGPWRWGDWSSNFGTLEQERTTLEHAPGYGPFPVVRHRDDEADEVLRLLDPLEISDESIASNAAHIARHDPARVLAEVAAKRAIVEAHEEFGLAAALVEHKGYDALNYHRNQAMAHALNVVLRYLALAYADHPDYQPEWRVEA